MQLLEDPSSPQAIFLSSLVTYHISGPRFQNNSVSYKQLPEYPSNITPQHNGSEDSIENHGTPSGTPP